MDYRRLEAAINLVFAEHDVDLLCPYDAGSLPARLLEIGLQSHSAVRTAGGLTPNARYDDPLDLLAGLRPDVVDDVALAVTEVLTNVLLHGEPPALLHVYDEGPSWVCHVHDAGPGPLDPLVGLLPPAEPSDHGYGLWLARQLCAAVDVGNVESGTHVRLHTRTLAHSD